MQDSESTARIQNELGRLFGQGLKITSPLQDLHLIREKICTRGLKDFDKGDILDTLGRMQHVITEINGELLKIYDLLEG